MNDALRRSAAHVVVADLEAVELDALDEHHLVRVLRLRDGERVTATDGEGSWRPCTFRSGTLEPDGSVVIEPGQSSPVTVAFAIPKQDRPEWVVQKLTELGVDRIVLVDADRSVVRWDAVRRERNLEKFRRIAREASAQSRRVWLPEVVGPVPSREVLAETPVAEPGGRRMTPEDRALAIGPEGGWSPEELEVAMDRIDLVPTILRVETAAVTAGALLADRRLHR